MDLDLAGLDRRHFSGYGPAAIPDPRDDEIGDLVDGIIEDGPAGVSQAIAIVGELAARVLLAYAERIAIAAVRHGQRLFLVRALVAAVVGGLHAGRPEALMVVSLIEDAANRIEVDVQLLFGEVAELVGHPGSVELMRWLSRPADLRTIDQMGYAVGVDDGGFRYLPRR